MKSEELNNASTPEPADSMGLVRKVSLMDCQGTTKTTSGRRDCCLRLTFGSDDGSVEEVSLSRGDAKRLIHQLALALHLETLPCGPANIETVMKKWLIAHTPGRAELNVDGDGDAYLYELRHSMPELGEYVDAQLAGLKRALRPTGRSAATAETIIRRVKRMLMISIDTARIDT